MMGLNDRVVLTGGGGFLGFHARAVLHSLNVQVDVLPLGDAFDLESAVQAIDGATRLIHLAGVNRGSDDEIRKNNLLFADQLSDAIARCEQPPNVVTYANSIQAGNATPYGDSKSEAGAVLGRSADAAGADFVDLALPNLFGEHGRPFYNSVTATFAHMLANGEVPEVKQDKILTLLHAQNAAELLVGLRPADSMSSLVHERSVSDLLHQLTGIAEVYSDGSIPILDSGFDRDLFNTYRSYLSPDDRLIKLNRHADARGAFFEIVRSHGGSGQTSFSTTVPGVTRGQHYHRRKIERFTVLAGTGSISLRRIFSDEVLTFRVTGQDPVAIDMPTFWCHNVVNSGADLLYTMFWSNELFDATAPDTFAEDV